jgi:DNA-binding FadR family transcriptional regulator
MASPEPSPFTQVRSTRAHELIVSQLQELILGGKLAPGDRLPSERAMMAQFAVSRPTVREALRVAESMGLVSVRPGDPGGPKVLGTPSRGIARVLDSVLDAGQASTLELLELRVAVETSAAVLASLRPRKARAAVGEVLEQMRACEDAAQFIELDARFHEAVIAASGNRLLELVFAAMNQSVRRLIERRLSAQPAQNKKKTLEEHEAIFETIEEGDGARAAKLVRRHLEGFYEPVLPPAEARRFAAYIQGLAPGGAKKH